MIQLLNPAGTTFPNINMQSAPAQAILRRYIQAMLQSWAMGRARNPLSSPGTLAPPAMHAATMRPEYPRTPITDYLYPGS